MTHQHSDIEATTGPDEHSTDQAASDELIPPITSDWAPEVGEYRLSTT